ncbi:hypothetical protein BMR07_12935 [Methylococcaceae bacterium CS1]|uniref:hypothetical protein n=1 Tax=Bathymodiolus platifrons methanotrophic gill symbiont TaxID=113268 RepID=UPI000B421BE1|nr:hypothetical protein [Bathymodiolus platifrons methanotrophic gill symbiont]TXK93368.1 hypothetical protein BMR11_17055 [Methylococcaceae bacterium CS5]TXL02681.1 hypothetical protein BMR09_16395 [Methylococcaceae bacterium CS3]TXL04250.1 hypothetical protein BMR07_12935 [Methylococcaceae bacterium CS1]TXL09423.1 hypothetical protein BMR08_13360 [Methylococcaceae bacterium CS2]
MPKKVLGKSKLLKDATKEAQEGEIDLNATVLMTHAQILELSKPKERRTAGKMVYITPSEMEAFLGSIGRESYSNAVRGLILEFIENNKDEE